MVNSSRERLAWMDVFKKHANITELERTAVVDMIKCIYVYEDRRIEVVFRYADECERTLKLLNNVPEDARARAAV